jgi:protein-L-isoaspartate(D-aspartate) O-methyltransferase
MHRNAQLVDHLLKRGVLQTDRIVAAFRAVDRIDFVRNLSRPRAYGDRPLSIGHGQTISQPFTVAFMLEELRPRPGERVLDVGSGSGWTTALLAHIVGTEGSVWGTEILPELVVFGRRNLAKYSFPNAHIAPAGRVLGRPGERFDRILVSAAARELPAELVGQLAVGGRLVIPVGSSIVRLINLGENETQQREHIGFAFVPLIY